MQLLNGISGSSGAVKGKIVFFKIESANKTADKLDLEEARQICIKKMKKLYSKTLENVGEEEAKIFSAYEMLFKDEALFQPIRKSIESGVSEEQAINNECSKVCMIFESMKDEYMRQRADDIKFICSMLIKCIKGEDYDFELPEGSEPVILAAKELSPADTMNLDVKRLAGIITELGGTTSHTVILSKSLGIPAVVGTKELMNYSDKYDGLFGLLDGDKGILICEPDEASVSEFDKRIEEERKLKNEISKFNDKEAVTKDGKQVSVLCNIGSPKDLSCVKDTVYNGVGLYRSEFLYVNGKSKPKFDEQIKSYKTVIDTVYPNPVTIRTLDIGGDKEVSYLNLPKEENPFLGNRGIRLCFCMEELFTEQIKAILKSADGKKVKIMFPMITELNEIKKAREFVENALQELYGHTDCKKANVDVGIMIETPAAAVMSDKFSKYCDFFSIGTNDLIQYVTCADRGNDSIQEIYNPFNPAVIRMIRKTIEEGKKAGIEVSVCGDLAANVNFIPLLLGIGLEKFSVPGTLVNKVKYLLSKLDYKEMKALADKVDNMDNAEEIENEVKSIIKNII